MTRTAITKMGVIALLITQTAYCLDKDLIKGLSSIRLSADKITWSDTGQQGTFYGNVQFDQAEKHLRADIAHTFIENNTLQKAKACGQDGKLAHFWAVDPKTQARQEAFATCITYIQARDEIYLEGNAKVQQNKNIIQAQTIRYNIKTRAMTAQGQAGKGTEVIFYPEKRA